MIPSESIGSTVPSSSIVRTLCDCLDSLEIQCTIHDLVFSRWHMYFCSKTNDVSCRCQDKRAIHRHEIRQQMSAFKNSLIQVGQAIIPNLLILLPADCVKPVLSSDFRERPNRSKNQFSVAASRLGVFNPVLRANRSVGTDKLIPLRACDDDQHAAMSRSSDLTDHSPHHILGKHSGEIEFHRRAGVVIAFEAFVKHPLRKSLLKACKPTCFVDVEAMALEFASEQCGHAIFAF